MSVFESAGSDLMADEETPTLFEWAGGRPALERLINAFYDRVDEDELLSPCFPAASARSTAPT